jgi:hypothetical protein
LLLFLFYISVLVDAWFYIMPKVDAEQRVA